MSSIKQTARLAGFLYLVYIVATVFASFVRGRLIVLGDAAATAENIAASEALFRLGFMSDVLAALLFVLSAWALYVLLKPVNTDLALLFVLLNLAGVAVQSLNMLNQLAPLLLLSGTAALRALPADQLQALAMVFLEFRKNGFMIAQVFYAAWLFPLGYLVYKSGFLPKVLGILLMLDSAFWLMTALQAFLSPGFDVITYLSYPLGFIAEVGLSLWLLIKGVQDQPGGSLMTGRRPDTQTPISR